MKKIFMWSLLAFAAVAFSACGEKTPSKPDGGGGGGGGTHYDYEAAPKSYVGDYIEQYPSDNVTMVRLVLSDATTTTGDYQKPVYSEDCQSVMLVLFTNVDAEGVLAPGVYKTVTTTENPKPGTCFVGGSGYFEIESGEAVAGAVFKAGSVTVTKVGDVYTIDGVVTLADSETLGTNKKFHFKFVSKLTLEQKYNFISTLTEDVTVEHLESLECEAFYLGDKFFDLSSAGIEAADTWILQIMDDKKGGVMIMTVSPALGFDAGLQTGNYTPSMYYPAPGATEGEESNPYTIVPGEIGSKGEIFPSMYMGEIKDGMVEELAPFFGGEVSITKEQNGEYVIDFDVIDDNPTKPHHIMGGWIGKPKFTDDSKQPAPAMAPAVAKSPMMTKIATR